ncbi:hypothetical protein [Olivibacter domesticus]|uniref:Uncharacterized protein n=1 Tax=Olivibacter domesticus TaxID=407022 RepID=A0A1H7IAC5_OLID1|nr:hypothetical protein [Olivibacter domesticus]SEK59501.1 hypothetical protein SAMN05661044_00638 [Olivibacter domesticus]
MKNTIVYVLYSILSVFMSLIFIPLFNRQQLSEPVSWSYGIKRRSATEYNIYFRAKIIGGWHIYSAIQTESNLATVICFNNVWQVKKQGSTIEVGNKITGQHGKFGIMKFYYERLAYFIVTIKMLSEQHPLSVSGTIKFVAGDQKKCLPVKEIPFRIAIKSEHTIQEYE